MDLEAQVQAARIRSVFERLWATSLITVVNATLIASVLFATDSPSLVWPWTALVVALAAVRTWSWWAYRRRAPGEDALGQWVAMAVAGSFLSGVLWGGGSVLLSSPNETGELLWVFLIGGMCAGAASLHAAHLPTSLAYILPAGLPLAIALASQGDHRSLGVAAMIVVFVAALCFTCVRFNRHFGETIRLQIALKQRSIELDQVNARLRAEIADHRNTGESLRQAQKMEAIGQLTGGVAHDFNNLLTVIAGNLELILGRAKGEEDLIREDIVRLAAAAERAAERGGRLTASLLSFARKQALRPEPLDVNAAIRDFEPLLRRTMGETVELDLTLRSDLHRAVADGAHFQAALLNLAINARDAMAHGRRVTISTANIALSAGQLGANRDAAPGLFVAITVCDTGIGMTPEVAAKAFEPFFTTKDAGKGSGLGLSQVYGFARQSGGHTTIETRPGGGTSVSIFLPVAGAAAELPTSAAEAAPAANEERARVLLVEDDAELLAVLDESLSLAGWDVIAVPDGRTAMGVIDGDEDIDILVTDVVMPAGVSGIDLARSAARSRPNLPVVLISGYPTATLEAHEADESEFDLLRKPFSSTELIARMQRARDHRAAVRPN